MDIPSKDQLKEYITYHAYQFANCAQKCFEWHVRFPHPLSGILFCAHSPQELEQRILTRWFRNG